MTRLDGGSRQLWFSALSSLCRFASQIVLHSVNSDGSSKLAFSMVNPSMTAFAVITTNIDAVIEGGRKMPLEVFLKGLDAPNSSLTILEFAPSNVILAHEVSAGLKCPLQLIYKLNFEPCAPLRAVFKPKDQNMYICVLPEVFLDAFAKVPPMHPPAREVCLEFCISGFLTLRLCSRNSQFRFAVSLDELYEHRNASASICLPFAEFRTILQTAKTLSSLVTIEASEPGEPAQISMVSSIADALGFCFILATSTSNDAPSCVSDKIDALKDHDLGSDFEIDATEDEQL